jgi:hypothetical protein
MLRIPLMPERLEDQTWYREWREALERVIATSMARDRTITGTPERAAAEKDCDAALAEFRKIGNERPWTDQCTDRGRV